MRTTLLLILLLPLGACGSDTAPAADPPPATATQAEPAEQDMMPTMRVADDPMDTAEVVAEGRFAGAGDHAVAGRAALYRLDDGSYTVRLEGLESDNGPDLRVWLVRDLDDKADGPIDLGALKSTRGDQNYPVPAGTLASASDAVGVSVWCRAFSVEFGTAKLE